MTRIQTQASRPTGQPQGTIFGRLAVEKGLVTAEEVQEAMGLLKGGSADGQPQSLAETLVKTGCLTQRQLDRLHAVAAEEARPSQQIPGFQILSKLGAGAMATVYKARQLSLDRIVAIKVLPKRLSENREFVERFYREGKAAAQLNHSNIVQAIDVGEAGGYHYFVMEYVEGHTVFDVLAKHKVFDENDALKVVIQVAEALIHAHDRGFIHRDVKPKNVMITSAGVAKLADMGLAREASDRDAALSEAGRAYGTPFYISPEQIRGEVDIDFRADIYSLGVTFYHMVTGKEPFDGPTPSAVMHKHLKQPLIPPDHINTKLSTGVGEIIETMMAKDRTRRYGSTKDLQIDLQAAARGEPPLQARKTFDTDLLESLSEGQAAPEHQIQPQSAGYPSAPTIFLIILGGLLTLSALLNLLLLTS